MNLKQRFSFIFSLLFSVLLGSVLLSVYFLFSNFRRTEFRTRLVQRAETTVKFLVGVKGINPHLLELFDRNRLNRLNNEKTTVYNDKLQRLYTSNNKYSFDWSVKDFEEVKKSKFVFKVKDEYDVIGMRYQHGGKIYYVLTSAEDVYDNPYLNFLKYLLLGAFLFGTLAVWSLSYYLSKTSLKPLDRVRTQIQEITDRNLNTRLPVSKTDDEINALSQSFNQMMDRIDTAYHRQAEFTGNASHELRTPIARITAQLENLLHQSDIDKDLKRNLKNVSRDAYQLSDIVTSLLVLSEINNFESLKELENVRLDEVIFYAANSVSKLDEHFKFNFDIESKSGSDIKLNIFGDETLLRLVFVNLFKNAYLYSDNKTANCIVSQSSKDITISVSNTGTVPVLKNTSVLFNTFVRGNNVKNSRGSGVGLSIVKRILHYHHASIEYLIPEKNLNQIVVVFPMEA